MKTKLLLWTTLLLLCFGLGAAELVSVKQQYSDEELIITPQFKLQLSEEIKEAINSGIVITFVIQVQMMKEVSWWYDSTISRKLQTFKLRYFSLSRQYQLNNISQKSIQTFVTLELLLNHLSGKTQFNFQKSNSADYIETKLFLDKQALPSTMQLPIVFDQDWNINSGWQQAKVMAAESAETP